MRNLILLAAVVGVVLILRYYLRNSPAQLGRFLRQFGLALVLVVVLLLLVTGRLSWVLALPAAAMLLFNRLQPLLRYVPFLHGLYQRYQTQRSNKTGPNPGQHSSVTARYVRMTLDLDSGVMEGEVLLGTQQGKRLSQLSLPQLITLINDWQDDEESIALLQAYLERNHPDWQEQAANAGTGYQSSSGHASQSGRMSRDEACQILGVADNASEEEIINAHRRLMQKLHPDRGGSTYLAAKINQAKDVLLHSPGK